MKKDNLAPDASAAVIDRAKKIKVLLMDVDGVMTDGKLYYFPGSGGAMVETKGFDTQDGLGLFLCFEAGILTGVISGRQSAGTEERARILKMRYVYQGKMEKMASYDEILKDAGVTPDQVAFIGDDFPDVPLMMRSGLGVAVANAREEVKGAANFVTQARGGEGAVREVIELILKSQGLWTVAVKKYFGVSSPV